MRFAHLADVHIGAWRDPRLKELPIKAFELAVTDILERKPDFVLIAGDFFNTSVPPLDQVKRAVAQLQRFRNAGIPVYAIAGSHDYSPTGKTMLDVLEEAGLMVNVMKGSVRDGKVVLEPVKDASGVSLVGILGRAGGLDTQYYKNLDREILEALPNPKVFLFHAAITELKTQDQMESASVTLLPKGFDYYAGGHVHITEDLSMEGYPHVVYPGPLFPASFSELEDLAHGAYCFFDGKLERVPVKVKERVVHHLDADGKSAAWVNEQLLGLSIPENVVVLIRISGQLSEGRPSDIRFKEATARLYDAGAYVVMRNTTKLTTQELEDIHSTHASTEELEGHLIKEHCGRVPIDTKDEVSLTQQLLNILGEQQFETEKKYEYEERITKSCRQLLE